MIRLIVCTVVALVVSGCRDPVPPMFDSSQALRGEAALKCVSIANEFDQECYGASVVLTGFPTGEVPNGYKFSVNHPDRRVRDLIHDDFVAIFFRENPVAISSKVTIAGYVTNGGLYPVVHIDHVKPAELTGLEAMLVKIAEARQPVTAGQSDDKSAEKFLIDGRKEGARALEQWDAAIRQNNEEVKAALAARAVAHQVRLSHNLRVDTYGMPDGRWIACKTEIYAKGAPITTCDGEP